MNLNRNSSQHSRRALVGAIGAVGALPLLALGRTTGFTSGSIGLDSEPSGVNELQPLATPDISFSFIEPLSSFVFYDQPHVFAFGSDENLYHSFNNGAAWSAWQALNHPRVLANTNVPPTIVQVGSWIMVIWCALNGNVNVCFWLDETGWDFEDSPNTVEGYSHFSSEVRAAYLGPRIFLFATTTSGDCAWSEYGVSADRGVWDYIETDWKASGPPAVVIAESGLNVFWMSDSGQIHQTQFDPNEWEPWESVG